MTSSEMTKQEQRNLDGFEGYEDEVEGGEVLSPASRIIQGVKLKYTNEQLCCWLRRIAAAIQHYRGA